MHLLHSYYLLIQQQIKYYLMNLFFDENLFTSFQDINIILQNHQIIVTFLEIYHLISSSIAYSLIHSYFIIMIIISLYGIINLFI